MNDYRNVVIGVGDVRRMTTADFKEGSLLRLPRLSTHDNTGSAVSEDDRHDVVVQVQQMSRVEGLRLRRVNLHTHNEHAEAGFRMGDLRRRADANEPRVAAHEGHPEVLHGLRQAQRLDELQVDGRGRHAGRRVRDQVRDAGLVAAPVGDRSLGGQGADLERFRCEQAQPLVQGRRSVCLHVGIAVVHLSPVCHVFLQDARALTCIITSIYILYQIDQPVPLTLIQTFLSHEHSYHDDREYNALTVGTYNILKRP